jgi:hypothetical protein
MKSRSFLFLSLFPIAIALMLGGCVAGGFISIPRTPTDIAADIIAGGGSSVYIKEDGHFNPLRKRSKAVIDSIATITAERVVIFPGQSMTFGVAPGYIPSGMKIAAIMYQIDQCGNWKHVGIRSDYDGGPGSRFKLNNWGDGNHILTVRVVFTDCLMEDLNVINDVHVPVCMAPNKRTALNAKYGWG